MRKLKLKLKDIPGANTPIRRHLLDFTKYEFYENEVKKEGKPFFTEKELCLLEKKYEKNGMSKKDMMGEIYKKGWQLKENTIKSYIQKGLIPRALKRVKTDQGMISIYPSNMIRHINFTRYCLFSEDKSIEILFSLIKKTSIDDETLLRDVSLELDGYGSFGDDCLHELSTFVFNMLYDSSLYWVEESIKKAFSTQEAKLKKYLKKYKEIESIVDDFRGKVGEFEALLAENTTPSDMVSLGGWAAVLALINVKYDENKT